MRVIWWLWDPIRLVAIVLLRVTNLSRVFLKLLRFNVFDPAVLLVALLTTVLYGGGLVPFELLPVCPPLEDNVPVLNEVSVVLVATVL